MKRTLGNILVIVVLVFVTWQVKGAYYPTVVDRTITDTLFVNVPFPVETVKEVEKVVPKQVIRYKTRIDTVTAVKVVTDTVYVSTPDTELRYHTSFLTQYPTAHKFLGLNKSDDELSLTTLSPNGITDTNIWDVGNRNYTVGVNTNLRTSQRLFSAKYIASAGYLRYVDEGTFYLDLTGEFRIFTLPIQTTININKQPFIKAGIKYTFK